MGSVIGLPVTVLSTIADKGILYCILYYISYIYLRVTRYLQGKRLNDYDFNADDKPEKLGITAPELEWKLEPPQLDTPLEKVADDAFCFGTNSQGDSLLVHIARLPHDHIRCSLFFKLASGRTFTLPDEHLVQKENKEPDTFGSSRLKLQCLQPMRKWRIFFNGTLREGNNGKFEDKHVKFTFLWTASSEVFDFSNSIPEDTLAGVVASLKTLSVWSHLEKLKNMFNNHEQPGMILGTYNIEEENEAELYMWGIRGRYMGETRDFKDGDFLQVYGQFHSGACLHLEILNIPNVAKRLIHGFVMHSNGYIDPIQEFKEASSVDGEQDLSFCCGTRKYNLAIKKGKIESCSIQKEYPGDTKATSANMSLNSIEGRGFIFDGHIQRITHPKLSEKFPANIGQGGPHPMIVNFENNKCQDCNLTGGKGSSLGKLFTLSKKLANQKNKHDIQFDVPKGIVVTTEAYSLFTRGDLKSYLEDFQKKVWGDPHVDINEMCERAMKRIRESEFPKILATDISKNLEKIFGNSALHTKFAVRSSATGEDTEQMSAAGQMETFLGMKGIEQITNAVKKCWASQFSFQAVEYKRRYGQHLNTPMAVVIQEMVPCEVAGVLFTCDPVTGNPAFISITANWGLGETVVSASADPDTIVLKRDILNTLKMHSYQIGNKEKKIVMVGEFGTKEVEVGNESNQLCINEEMALRLGKIAVMVEQYYGAPRDVEWGIVGHKFFLFQARPITSLDVDTDFEIRRGLDNFVRMEKEYVTKANIGEVMPGALSPLGIDTMTKTMACIYARQGIFRLDGASLPDVPYFHRLCHYAYWHGFITFTDGLFRSGMEDKKFVKAMMISILGRVIEGGEMAEIAEERHSHSNENTSALIKFGTHLSIMKDLLAVPYTNKRKAEKASKIEFPPLEGLSAARIFREIGLKFYYIMDTMNMHIHASACTSNWNMFLMTLLAKDEDDFGTDVYSDFAYLLSTCTDVESADVPSAIQNLGKMISNCIDLKKFKSLNEEEALKYLKSSPAGEHFEKFIEKHGHRCLKEFDIQSKPWDSKHGMLKLVKMLQSYVTTEIKEISKKDSSTFSAILSHMHVHLDFLSRLKLRLILPNCRRAVSAREFSKSVLVKAVHKHRKAVQVLAKRMVQEGYLPNKELIYYLCFEEINHLLKTRSPRILTRAIKRQRVHAELEKLQFPEICCGIPTPINSEDDKIELLEGGIAMQGIPVSQGVVKGTARVIFDFEEVSNIQQDDILITYSTDIGWSPYFPLLSGVVTELGGLISHGAVVAREYGLPCVVSLHGATKVFKSGDTVYLDGNKGILRKIESE